MQVVWLLSRQCDDDGARMMFAVLQVRIIVSSHNLSLLDQCDVATRLNEVLGRSQTTDAAAHDNNRFSLTASSGHVDGQCVVGED